MTQDAQSVTQADRDTIFDWLMSQTDEQYRDQIRGNVDRGEYDAMPMMSVAMFTRHRLAIQPTSAEDAWRPIETAPKDGTVIILGAPAQEYQGKPTMPRSTIGHWTTDEECMEQIGDCGGECRCPEYKFHEPEWLSWDGGFTEENPPTHWMPLPAPPEQS